MDLSKVASLKVVELKKELESRGLDSKGLKADLVARLSEALKNEQGPDSEAGTKEPSVVESNSEAKESSASDAKDVNGIDADSKQPSQPADESQADVKPPAEVAAPAKDAPATQESAEKGDDASGKRTREEDDDEDASKRSKADDSQAPAANEAQAHVGPPSYPPPASSAPGDAQPTHDATATAAALPPPAYPPPGQAPPAYPPPAGAPPYAPPSEQPPSYDNAQAAGQQADSNQQAYYDPNYAYYWQQYNYAQYYQGYGAYPGYEQYGGAGVTQTVVVEVPNDKVGLVIGKGGCTIKELQQRTGCKMQITPDAAWAGKSDPRPIQLQGTEQQIYWVEQLIAEKINIPIENILQTQQVKPGLPPPADMGLAQYGMPPPYGAPTADPPVGAFQTFIIKVPNDKVGLVIGKGGCTIKEIQQRSGVKMQITPDAAWAGRAEPRPVQVQGTSQQIYWAKYLIAEKVNLPIEQLETVEAPPGS